MSISTQLSFTKQTKVNIADVTCYDCLGCIFIFFIFLDNIRPLIFDKTSMSFIALFRRQVRTYIYNPVYKGPFEYKKSDTMMSKFPFGANRTKLESVLSEIKEVQSNPISQQDVSPFHLVARYKPFAKATW